MISNISNNIPVKVSNLPPKNIINHKNPEVVPEGNVHGDVFVKDSRENVSRTFREKHEVSHEGMEAIHVGAEVLEALEVGGLLAVAGTVGSLASGVFFGIEGAHDLKKAVKEKDVMGGIEAGAHLAVAGEAGLGVTAELAETAAVSGIIGHSVAAALSSPLLHVLGTSLGVAHGVGEVIVGAKDVIDGKKEHDKFKMLEGGLKAGLGVAVGAIALGGGAPMGIALAVLFGAKMLLKTKHGKHLKHQVKIAFNNYFSPDLMKKIDLEKESKVV